MSTVIDSKVVEMKFNNSQFESGVQQTLSTLAKLKSSLNFEGAVKGLADIGSAAKNLTFDTLGGAVDTVGTKFNALQEIAIGAFRRIGDEVGGLVLKMGDFAKSMSIDQIGNGFNKYAQKTSSVQTIMAATADQFTDTGEQMEYVNGQLDKLNWFTDETSYNFLDMVSNIGKFTSNGIELEKAVTAMQGISNWAAISGQTKNEASRAMYNLSQALAVGEVKLMDWRSIENANMATKEFKEKVLEAAVANGKLQKAADGTFKTIGKGTKVSVEAFSNSLSEGWFDSKTLMDVLGLYGATTDKLYDLSTATGATATDILTLVEAEQKGKLTTAQLADTLGDAATPASIASLKQGIQELASAENEFGIKTFRAAQEAKTFEEAIDSVKDAVSTGWMQTFELIFGDYEKARVMWTDVANNMWDIFNGGAEDRNDLLKDWASSGWEKLEKDIRSTGVSVSVFEKKVKKHLTECGYDVNGLIAEYGSLGEAIENNSDIAGDLKYAIKESINDILRGSGSLESVEEKLEAVQKAVSDIWSGELGNGADRKEALEDMGFDYETIQKLVNKGKDYTVTLEDLTDEELEAIGLGEEEIALLREIMADEERLLGIAGQKGGRELFGEAINQGLVDIVQTIQLFKNTWSDVIGNLEADHLRDLTKQFRDWTESMALYEENSEGVEVLTERGSKLRAVLEKLMIAGNNTFGIIQNGVRLFGELASSASPAAEALGRLAEAVLNLFNAGSGKFTDFLSELDFSDRLTPIAERVAGIVDSITEKIDNLRKSVQGIEDIRAELEQLGEGGGVDLINNLEAIQVIGHSISSIFDTVANSVLDIAEAFAPVADALGGLGSTALYKFAQAMEHIADIAEKVRAAFKPLADTIGKDIASGIERVTKNLSSMNLDGVFSSVSSILTGLAPIATNLWKILTDIGSVIATVFEAFTPALEPLLSIFAKLIGFAGDLSGSLADLSGGLTSLLTPVIETLGAGLTKVLETIDKLLGGEKLGNIFKPIADAFTKAGEATGGLGEKFKTFFDSLTEGNTLSETFGGIWEKITGIFEQVGKALDPVLTSISENLKPMGENLDKFWKSIVEGFDFKNAKTMGDYIEKFFEGIGTTATSALKGIVKGLTKIDLGTVFKGIFAGKVLAKIVEIKKQFTDIAGGVGEAVGEILKTVMDRIKGSFDAEGGFETFAKSIKDVAIAIGILTAALVVLSLIPQENLTKGVTALTGAITALMVPLSIIYTYVGKSTTWPGFLAMAGGMMMAAVAAGILAVALVITAGALAAFSYIVENMKALEGFEYMAGSLMAIALALGLLAKYCNGFGLLAAAAAILITAGALIVLAGAVAAFALIAEHMEGLNRGLQTMGMVLGGVVIALAALSSCALGALVGAAALVVAGAALIVFAAAVAAFALVVQTFDMESTLIDMVAALLITAGAMAGFGAAAGIMLLGALTLAAAAVAIGVFSGAMALFLLALQLAEPALTALSAGFSALGTGLMDLLTGLGQGLMSFIAGIGAGIGEAIGGLFAGIGEGIGTGIAGIGTGIALAEEAIGAGFDHMATLIGDSAANAGMKIDVGLTAISDGIGKVGESFSGIATGIADIGAALGTFSTNVSGLGLIDLVKIGAGLKSVADGIKKLNENPFNDNSAAVLSYATALNNLSEVSTTLTTTGETLKSLASSIAQGMMQNFTTAIQNGASQANAALNSMASIMRASVRSLPAEFAQIGLQIANGLAQGIRNGTSAVTSAAQAVASAAKSAAESSLKIQSPSRVFAKIGSFISLGMAKGITDESGRVATSSEFLAESAISSAQDAMSSFVDIFNSEDMNPTITPILDLDGAMNRASQLSGALKDLRLGGSIGSYNLDADSIDLGARSMNVVPEMTNLKDYLQTLTDLTDYSVSTQGSNPVDVKVNFNGSLAQLAAVLQPAITAETSRIGKSLINA